jgi:hypothetical protein
MRLFRKSSSQSFVPKLFCIPAKKADAVGIRFLFYRCLVVAVLCIACILAGILRACILGAVGRILAGIVCIAAVVCIIAVVCIVSHNRFLLIFL